jgi:hypothetical protein
VKFFDFKLTARYVTNSSSFFKNRISAAHHPESRQHGPHKNTTISGTKRHKKNEEMDHVEQHPSFEASTATTTTTTNGAEKITASSIHKMQVVVVSIMRSDDYA